MKSIFNLLTFLILLAQPLSAQIHIITINSNQRVASLEMTPIEYTNWINNDEFTDYTKRTSLIKDLYRKFNDAFDFIFLVLNEVSIPSSFTYAGQNVSVSNDVSGIGKEIFNTASDYDSRGRLKSVIFLTQNNFIMYGPSLHELAHTWANFGIQTSAFYGSLIADYKPHWGFTGGSTKGQLGGFLQSSLQSGINDNPKRYKVDPFGQFANGGNSVPYTEMELYLMGMISSSSVTQFDVFKDITTVDFTSYEFEANTRITYNESRILTELGTRSPSYSTSQKAFRLLIVVLTDAPLTTAEWDLYDSHSELFSRNSSVGYPYNFWDATGGIGTIETGNLNSTLIPAGSITLSVAPQGSRIGSAVGATGSFSVISNTNWIVQDDADWLTLSTSGDSGDKTITVSANSSNTTRCERSAIVTFSAIGVNPVTVTVIQNGDPVGPISMSTSSITEVTGTRVISGGNILCDGGTPIIARGVCWSTTQAPTINLITKTSDGNSIGTYNSVITGLSFGTTYYLRAYATNSNSETFYGNEYRFKTYNPDQITDADGNNYYNVTIGSQVWMAENLKSTHFNDNSIIPLITINSNWIGLTTPAIAWYKNDVSNKDIYGGLYNYYAVNTSKLCPSGWHIPSDADWQTLMNFIGINEAGSKLKETGFLHWANPNSGATDEYSFRALPAGYKDAGNLGDSYYLNNYGFWWSSSGRDYVCSYNSHGMGYGNWGNNYGFSVRCLKDINQVSAHFTPVWWPGNGIDHMNLYAHIVTLNGVALQPGDEIGIYDGDVCVGVGVLITILDGSTYLRCVVSKDDAGTTGKDGFISGNNITFRVWDSSANVEISNVQAEYISGAGIFSPAATATFNLAALTSISQSISLTSGWNIFSFAVEPDNMSIMAIVNPLITAGTLVKVQDEKGLAIEKLPDPIGWIDNIGLMSVSEGYKIKVTINAILSTAGQPVTLPYTISLDAGWNIMGYPSMSSQDALTAFNRLITASTLIKVQDESGHAIEKLPDPIGWIDNINNISPGEGYKVKTTVNTSLAINNTGKGEYQYEEDAVIRPSHFKLSYSGNGLDHMNIYLRDPTIGRAGIKAGDEIGVFDGGRCVGAATVEGPTLEYLMVTASLDDPTTEEKDGFTEGNQFELVLWDRQAGVERKTQKVEIGKGYNRHFEKFGTSVLKADFEEKPITYLRDAYPNPSNYKTTFTFQLENEGRVRLEIFDIMGNMVKVLVNQNIPGGSHEVEWDNMSSGGIKVKAGIYFYKINMNGLSQIKALIIH